MSRFSVPQRVLAALAVATLPVTSFALIGAPSAGATTSSQTFSVPGGSTFVVPAGVTSLSIVAEGGAGAGETINGWTSVGGLGGRETATITVTPGEHLDIEVGGAAIAEVGGVNGGGSGMAGSLAGGGGGASDVRQGGTSLADRVVVAGGGGGGGRSGPGSQGGTGGDGGGTNGTDAFPETGGHFGMEHRGAGGGAGTTSAGGAGGAAVIDGGGTPGTLGIGGDGSTNCEVGAAGGGGYYGGGGGSSGCWDGGGGGGGGANYAAASATSLLSENGVNLGNGSVALTWNNPIPTTTAAPTTTTIVTPAPVTPIDLKPVAPQAKPRPCPTIPLRIQPNSAWAVNLLRFWCGSRVTTLRSGHTFVGYLVPHTWRWASAVIHSSTR